MNAGAFPAPTSLPDGLEAALVREGLVDTAKIARAREKSAENEKSLEENLVSLGFVSDQVLTRLKGQILGVRVVDLKSFPISPEAIQKVPEALAREHHFLPILFVRGTLTVAMNDPFDVRAIQAIEYASRARVDPVLVSAIEIRSAINRFYGVFGQIQDLAKEVERTSGQVERVESEAPEAILAGKDAGPVATIVKLLLTQAVHMAASDIHIEPQEKSCRVRFRVDGLLQEVIHFEKAIQSALLSSTKILAQMDIAERRVPQDGRFRFHFENRPIDLRVSSFPTAYGEKIVMRILDKEGVRLSLEDLGFAPEDLAKLEPVVRLPHGIFLVTGPTGSGKTTTLYSILLRVNDEHKNITTLEDPIEYHLEKVNQSQILPKAGFTFARGLRSILRQDPDIILVGEIRDQETAEIAIQSALTGHLVLSTLHTNDAPGAVTRLTDMGIEPFLVSSSLIGVLGQRLVRRVCVKCRDTFCPDPDLRKDLGLPADFEGNLYQAVGCRACNRTGYVGRTGVYELFIPDDRTRGLMVARGSTDAIRSAARQAGMRTMRQDGLQKAKQGMTSLEEVLRVTGEEEM